MVSARFISTPARQCFRKVAGRPVQSSPFLNVRTQLLISISLPVLDSSKTNSIPIAQARCYAVAAADKVAKFPGTKGSDVRNPSRTLLTLATERPQSWLGEHN